MTQEQVDPASLGDAAMALRNFASKMHGILRHKAIQPPMNPGVQESLENECLSAIAAHDQAIANRLVEKNRFAEQNRQLQATNIDLRSAVNLLADKLARHTGKTVPDEIRIVNETLANRAKCDAQSYDDLAASGGIVDAP